MAIEMKLDVNDPSVLWNIIESLPNTQNMPTPTQPMKDVFYQFCEEYLHYDLERGISGIDFGSMKTIDDCRDELMRMICEGAFVSHIRAWYGFGYEDFDDEEVYVNKSIDFIVEDMKDTSLPLGIYMNDISVLSENISLPYQYYLWIPEMDSILPFSIFE